MTSWFYQPVLVLWFRNIVIFANTTIIPYQDFLHGSSLFPLDSPVERETISNPNPKISKYPAGMDFKIRILHTPGVYK